MTRKFQIGVMGSAADLHYAPEIEQLAFEIGADNLAGEYIDSRMRVKVQPAHTAKQAVDMTLVSIA